MPLYISKLLLVPFSTCAGLALFAAPAVGQTNFVWVPFSNGVGHSFQDPASWSPTNGPPGATSNAIFSGISTQLAYFDSDWSVANLTIRNTTVTFNMNGRTLSADSQTIGEVAGQNVIWNLRNGNYVLNGSDVIGEAASTVNFILDHASYRSTGFTELGAVPNSIVNVTVRDGSSYRTGSVSLIGQAATSVATINVDGVGSSAFLGSNSRIGNNGSGTINVTNGGLFESTGILAVGFNVGSSGIVTLSNSGSRWSHTDGFIVTGFGVSTKTITVNPGTTLDIVGTSAAAGLTLGSGTLNANGTMNVSGLAGSNLTVSGGTMNVAGAVNVSGTGNSLNVSSGTLNLNAGANVTTPNFTRSGTGAVTWNGGALTVDGGVFNNSGAVFAVGLGDLTFQNGATASGFIQLNVSAAGVGGTLNVLSGATTTISGSVVIGNTAGQIGTATIGGDGSTLTSSSNYFVGSSGSGTLNVNSGGSVGGGNFFQVGQNAGSVGTINLNAGGTITSNQACVGVDFGTGTANVAGTWTTTSLFEVGGFSGGNLANAGTLNVNSGGQINVGTNMRLYTPGTLNMNGGSVTAASFTREGTLNFNDGTLTVNNGTFQNGAAASPLTIDGSTASANPTLVLSGLATSTTNVSALTVGSTRTGTLKVQNGAVMISSSVVIGSGIDSNGTVTVSGPNTFMTAVGAFTVGGGNGGGLGTLNIDAGSEVTATSTFTLNLPGTVNLNGGKLSVNGLVLNGSGGTGVFNWNSGTLQRTSNSTFSNADLTTLLGTNHSLNAGKTLTSFAGTMTMNGNLAVDGGILSPVNLTNNAMLTISGGSAAVGTTLTNNGNLTLDGGALSATNISNNSQLTINSGTAAVGTTLTNNGNLTLNSGTLSAGNLTNNAGKLVVVQNTGAVTATTVSNIGTLNLNGAAATVGANVTNNTSGLIFGTGTVNGNLTNNGTVRATGSERLTFTGTGHTNNLNMQLAGGTLEFLSPLTVNGPGAITGRGTLVTTGNFPGTPGLTLNSGATLLASAQTFDVYGDVQNNAGARIVTSGAGITTFFDDVLHNGTEIRTNAGSRTVFFGDQSGAGNFTGTGTVEYNGDYRPGNSPANVNYEGNVVFTSTAGLHAELGGTTFGSQYDRLTVQGSIELSGLLNVQFIDGFSPATSDQFTLIDNQGFSSIIGTFDGLPEGSSFIAQNMMFHITYQGGDGNNLMITAVPEPATLALFGVVIVGSGYLCWRRWKLYYAAIEATIESAKAS